jgi:hypothetical protein
MSGAVRIERLDFTANELCEAAGQEKDGSAAREMLALAEVLDGWSTPERFYSGWPE